MSKTEEHAEKICAFLQKNKNDRGIMADVRCGFSSAREQRAWRHIAAFCDLEKEWSRIPVQTLCAAFATQPKCAKYGNMGTTMHEIAKDRGKEGLKSFEGRFRRMLTCATKLELCALLPSIVRAAKAKEIPINYHQLYCDIYWWEYGKTKLEWAAEYWKNGGK